MAATNFTPIQLYFSTTASAAPTAANLAQGELAINITDGKLYYEDNGGVVQVIATKGAGTIGGSTTQIQYNNAGALAGNAAMVFNNSTNVTTLTTLNLTNALGAIYGGTAQSAYTQGDFLYASATNTLSKLGIGTVNYILTSSGSVPQWSAPSSIIVQTATNLAGGLAGSVPYQSALDTTIFLAIGAANRVMTSTGSAPQWVTSLTGLTGVSSSSITNTSLTSGRVVISSTAGLESDSANLTFNGTTLSTTGLSNTGFSTLVKTLTLGDSSFNGTAVFAAATPAKLYMGTGTVTDVTSAISATNTTGAIASLAITPIAATNTGVTYTNASTLYIAGAPSAGTNITITNPYSLYIAAGASYFGGLVTATGFAGPLNGTVGATTANTGAFTTLSASGASTLNKISATATSTLAFGGHFAFSAAASCLTRFEKTDATTNFLQINVTNTSTSLEVGNPALPLGIVGGTGLAVTGTLSATGAVTLSGGTANGVAYLDGSKVLTTGTAFTFDGANVLTLFRTTPTEANEPTIKFSNLTFAGQNPGVVKSSNGGLALDIQSPSASAFQQRSRIYMNGGSNDSILFQTSSNNGSTYGDRMVLTSTGLGIGTSSPAQILSLSSADTTGTAINIINTGTGGYNWNLFSVGSSSVVGNVGSFAIRDSTNAVTRLTIDTTGNLGIGTTSPSTKLDVGATSDVGISMTNSTSVTSGNRGTLYMSNSSNSTVGFIRFGAVTDNSGTDIQFAVRPAGGSLNSTAMKLDSSGKLFLGTTTTPTGTGSGIFNVEPGNQNGIAIGVVTTGNTGLDINVNNTGSYFAYFRYNAANVGSITTNGTITVYNTTSDYRLKTVVGAVSDSGSRIDALQPVEYTWNSNGERTRGFLAHQFQEVYANSVTGTKDAVDADGKPVYQAMQASTSEVIADLVAELQSLRARVAQLESKP